MPGKFDFKMKHQIVYGICLPLQAFQLGAIFVKYY